MPYEDHKIHIGWWISLMNERELKTISHIRLSGLVTDGAGLLSAKSRHVILNV